MGDLNRARMYAVSGYRPGLPSGWSALDRTVNAGIFVSAPNAYSIYVDRDASTDGDEYIMAVVTLPDPVTIVSPAVGQEIRFRQDGTTGAPSVALVISDPSTNVSRSVTVSGAGLSWLN
jgi:hypothetical protein